MNKFSNAKMLWRSGDFSNFDAPTENRPRGSIANRLAVDIMKGIYRPGEILPFQLNSSEALNVSRTPYREALKILSAKGFVESRSGRGTVVCERSRWNLLDPQVMGWMFELTPTAEYIDGLFELRLINEPAAAQLAAKRRTDEDLKRMKHTLDVMKSAGMASERGRRADLEFHKTLLFATHNEILAALNSSISAAIEWSIRLKSNDLGHQRDCWPEHYRVYEAIADRSPEFAKCSMEVLVRLALVDTCQSQLNQDNADHALLIPDRV